MTYFLHFFLTIPGISKLIWQQLKRLALPLKLKKSIVLQFDQISSDHEGTSARQQPKNPLAVRSEKS